MKLASGNCRQGTYPALNFHFSGVGKLHCKEHQTFEMSFNKECNSKTNQKKIWKEYYPTFQFALYYYYSAFYL